MDMIPPSTPSMPTLSNRSGRRYLRAMALCSVFVCMSFINSPQALSEGTRRIVSVRISHDPVRRAEDLKELSRFDVLGISVAEGMVELHATNKELKLIQESGFQFEFSPLNQQLQREAVEPYLTPTDVINQLSELSQAYPQQTQLKTIGYTRRKRPIQALIISANPLNTNQPTVLFNAMHHAREVMTTEVVMHLAQELLKNYGSDPETTHWMKTARIIVVPQVNPDGNQLVHDGQSMWRKNAWESDGRTFGVDVNRNYPTLWGSCNGSSASKMSDSFRGPSAASEPETAAMMQLVLNERPVANISYHSYSELIIYPYGCRSEKNPSLELFKSIASDMKANVIDDRGNKNTYSIGTAPELLYEADGTDIDWHFREAGVVSFALEVNGRMLGFQPSFSKWRDVTVINQEGAWKSLLRRSLSQGVKGVLRSSQLSDVSYRLSLVKPGLREDFTGGDASVRPFRPRSAGGFIFNTLLPGTYVIDIQQAGTPIKSIQFSVAKDAVTDLGDIRL